MRPLLPVAFALLLAVLPVSAQQATTWHDPSQHKIQFVTMDKDVKLEVLDWGGSGRPLVLLAGAGETAHCVIFIPHGHHYIFISNEADVLREMRFFIKQLP